MNESCTGFQIQQRLSGTRARAQKPPNSSAAASSSRPPVPLSAWMHTSLLKPNSCSRRTLSSQPAGRPPPPPPLGAAAEGGCAAPAVGTGAGTAGAGAADKRHGCGQQEVLGPPSKAQQEFGSQAAALDRTGPWLGCSVRNLPRLLQHSWHAQLAHMPALRALPHTCRARGPGPVLFRLLPQPLLLRDLMLWQEGQRRAGGPKAQHVVAQVDAALQARAANGGRAGGELGRREGEGAGHAQAALQDGAPRGCTRGSQAEPQRGPGPPRPQKGSGGLCASWRDAGLATGLSACKPRQVGRPAGKSRQEDGRACMHLVAFQVLQPKQELHAVLQAETRSRV